MTVYQNKEKSQLNRKRLVLFFMIIVIAAVWVLKNSEKQSAVIEMPSEAGDFALHVTESLDIEKLKSHGLPIIIDFGADSCIPCKEMAPVLVELNQEYRGKAIVKFVDVWKYQNLAEGYPIRVIPTQVFIDASGNPFQPEDPAKHRMTMYASNESGEHVFTVHEGGMTRDQLVAVLKEMGVD